MKLIVGLGNPGKQYEKTRHNVGFMVLDAIAQFCKLQFRCSDTAFLTASGCYDSQKIVLVKPDTFVNRSGDAVRICLKKYRPAFLKEMLVVVDDVHLPLGRLRFRTKGSSGGHRGLESIITLIRTQQFPRLRVGISEKEMMGSSLTPFVIGRFKKREGETLKKVIGFAREACLTWVRESPETVMNRYNQILISVSKEHPKK